MHLRTSRTPRTAAPRRGRRRALTALAGAALMTGAMTGLAAPAHAAEVTFDTECTPPPILGVGPIQGVTTADITVDNETPAVGDTVTVTYTIVEAAANNPVDIDLPADVVKPSGSVTLGGAQSGDVAVEGPRSNPPVPGLGAFPSASMTGTFTVEEAGEITLTPGDYGINTNFILDLDTPCTVLDPPAPVSLTINAG